MSVLVVHSAMLLHAANVNPNHALKKVLEDLRLLSLFLLIIAFLCPAKPDTYIKYMRIHIVCNQLYFVLFLDGNHQFVLLKALGEAIKLKFDPKLLAVSEQISRLCNLEKEAWQTVDEYTENATKMDHQVEERAEEQVLCTSYYIN